MLRKHFSVILFDATGLLLRYISKVDVRDAAVGPVVGRWQSGQLQQAVNLSPLAGYGGSNPSLPTIDFESLGTTLRRWRM